MELLIKLWLEFYSISTHYTLNFLKMSSKCPNFIVFRDF